MAKRKTKQKVSQRTLNKRRKGRIAKAQMWLRRFGITLGVVAFTVWAGAWFFLSDADSKTAHWTKQTMLEASAGMGFSVANILVEGRKYSDADVLLAIINVEKGDPLFSFNPDEAQELIEKVAWVKAAHVERRLPDTIYVGLEERQPLALWQKDKKLRLIDADGEVLTDRNLKKFKDLIIVVGVDAPARAPGLLNMLAAEPALGKRVESASWIGGRRWDMKLEGGINVSLPEDDIGFALRRLSVAQEEDGLLDKDIVSIDLRKEDRIIVRTRPGKVQEYKAGMKVDKSI
ncbi:MAG: hypothetical protein DHS20C02_18670 [Micavibrio sp.]|nr:MAG: hypothetical protein DHS20C02_18670 [Micavibrio sp.]